MEPVKIEIDKLKKIGGKEWKNYGLHRVYFNKLDKLLENQYPNYTKEMSDVCSRGKFWYDVDKERFYCQNLTVADCNLKQILIDIICEFTSDNEFTSILADFDDI